MPRSGLSIIEIKLNIIQIQRNNTREIYRAKIRGYSSYLSRCLRDRRKANRSSSDPSSSGAGSESVELAEDVEGGDEADEAEAHDEDDGGANLEPRRVVRVEPEHVAASSAAESTGATGATSGSADPPPPHPGRRGGRAARGRADGSGPGGGGRRCLGLRCASCHG